MRCICFVDRAKADRIPPHFLLLLLACVSTKKKPKLLFSILRVYTIICIKQYRGRYFIETFFFFSLPAPIYTTASPLEIKNCIKKWKTMASSEYESKKFYHKRFIPSLSLSKNLHWTLNGFWMFLFLDIISICERCANNNIIVTIKMKKQRTKKCTIIERTFFMSIWKIIKLRVFTGIIEKN